MAVTTAPCAAKASTPRTAQPKSIAQTDVAVDASEEVVVGLLLTAEGSGRVAVGLTTRATVGAGPCAPRGEIEYRKLLSRRHANWR